MRAEPYPQDSPCPDCGTPLETMSGGWTAWCYGPCWSAGIAHKGTQNLLAAISMKGWG